MNRASLAQYMKHALQFSSAEEIPALLARSNGEVGQIGLKGEKHFSFSEDKFCIGYKNNNEKFLPCPHGMEYMKQCPSCQKKDIARVYTVGDFSQYPEMHEKLQEEKYIIYLAQFGSDITKIGLTRRPRMEKRWKEQGADFAIALLEFDGPDDAYPAEQLLQNSFDVVGAVRATQKIKRISFDREKARGKLKKRWKK
ncbi:MAG: DUF2797 domain-containing protein [Candidatus Micrarchaeota archaeon]